MLYVCVTRVSQRVSSSLSDSKQNHGDCQSPVFSVPHRFHHHFGSRSGLQLQRLRLRRLPALILRRGRGLGESVARNANADLLIWADEKKALHQQSTNRHGLPRNRRRADPGARDRRRRAGPGLPVRQTGNGYFMQSFYSSAGGYLVRAANFYNRDYGSVNEILHLHINWRGAPPEQRSWCC